MEKNDSAAAADLEGAVTQQGAVRTGDAKCLRVILVPGAYSILPNPLCTGLHAHQGSADPAGSPPMIVNIPHHNNPTSAPFGAASGSSLAWY